MMTCLEISRINSFKIVSPNKKSDEKGKIPPKNKQKTVERVFAFELLVITPIQLNQKKPLEVEDLKLWGSSAIPTSEVNHNQVVIFGLNFSGPAVENNMYLDDVFQLSKCLNFRLKKLRITHVDAIFCLKLKEIYDYRIRHLDKNNRSAYPARQFQKTPIRNKCFFWNP